ncbi:MAG: hypothetical protein ABI186_00725 [Candidatus Elarobacter sp.]
MIRTTLASLCVTILGLLGTGTAIARTMPMPMEQTTRYHGTPDLALTAALVEAGGGAAHFDAGRLLGVLAADNRDAEVRHLQHVYGPRHVAQFVRTFTFAIDDALRAAKRAGVALPAAAPGRSADGEQLAASLWRAGTLPNGRFDIGYMLEHLISRPIHVQIMRDINADPHYGPVVNADFHRILTTAMDDLKSAYRL